MADIMGSQGPSQGPPIEVPPLHRCTRCFAELYEADRGYGSTAWACPEHGFDRQILTIPGWVEGAAKDHPGVTLRYIEWLFLDDALTAARRGWSDPEDFASRMDLPLAWVDQHITPVMEREKKEARG